MYKTMTKDELINIAQLINSDNEEIRETGFTIAEGFGHDRSDILLLIVTKIKEHNLSYSNLMYILLYTKHGLKYIDRKHKNVLLELKLKNQ